MSAETLRRAASLMRERAEAATPSRWIAVAGAWGLPSDGPDHIRVVQAPPLGASDALARLEWDRQGGDDAEHIASWHPAVALAVADWLDAEAQAVDSLAAFAETTSALVREESWTVRGAALTVGQKEDGSIIMRADTSSPAIAVAHAYLGESA